MLTNLQLVDFCERVYAAKWVYWYGTYGKKCTQSLYDSKRKQYPTHYTAARAARYREDIAEGRTCADCVGMIKAFFWTGGVFGAVPGYATDGCPDTSANGMIGLCRETGPIAGMPDIPGLVVWKKGHIGVYVGGGYTIEMRGFKYGCVKRKVKDGPWTKWGKLPPTMLEYVTGCAGGSGPSGGSATPPTTQGDALTLDRVLKKGCVGEDVKRVQRALIRLGYDCGGCGADGEYGPDTVAAVKRFQRVVGLAADGEVGPGTLAALNRVLADPGSGEAEDVPRGEVRVTGGTVNVRDTPDTSGRVLGVAARDDRLPWLGQTSPDGWHKVAYRGKTGWISGKYSDLLNNE